MRTPPGVSEADFATALQEFANAVGKAWVFTDEADLDTYRDAYSPLWGEAEEKVASAAVAPDSVEQVQAVVRIANRFAIPLYTISTGRNLAYGGSAPVLSGSVVLDLKRMNRILEVSEKNAYALVEPGVSYFDLYRHIREKGLKLWLDVPDPGWGSLVGNALDHGAGRTPLPYRDHFDAHCGMEVVLANGEVFRTGMGALPKAETWQQFKYGAGPFMDGIFSQSNYGIVTKMGFYLYPEPQAARVGRIRARRHDDVIPLVEILSNLAYAGIVVSQYSVISPVFQGPPDAEKTALRLKPDGGSAAEWDAYAASRNLHFWQTELYFYGPPKIMAAQWEHVKERLSAIPGVVFEEGPSFSFPLSDDQVRQVADPAPLGLPSLGIFSMMQTMRAEAATTGHLDVSPIVPMSGEALLRGNRVFARTFLDMGVQPTLGFAMTYHWRSFIMFQGFSVTQDPTVNAKARDAYLRIMRVAADNGWGVYRAHTAFMDQVMDTYSFNDHAIRRVHETLKDALDPNGILSAGRYGIWPKRLREGRA